MIDEIRESNDQLTKAWRRIAVGHPKTSIADRDGVTIASAGVTWALFNAAFLSSPAASAEDLKARVAQAADHFEGSGLHWIFPVSHDWLGGDARASADSAFAAHRLRRVAGLAGMVTDALTAPVRPLPQVEIRSVLDEVSRRDICDVNSVCYQAPLELGREAADVESLWSGADKGYVGYVDGKAITTTAVFPIDSVAYVGWVATLPQYERRGYAEAMMRHGLEQANLVRTVLHATPQGKPLYERMGYRVVSLFDIYAFGE